MLLFNCRSLSCFPSWPQSSLGPRAVILPMRSVFHRVLLHISWDVPHQDVTFLIPFSFFLKEPAKYSFNYEVKDEPSDNDYGHQEARDGAHTQGKYFVKLPDGRLQEVAYTVDGDSGFVAEVRYEGEPQYPQERPTGYA